MDQAMNIRASAYWQGLFGTLVGSRRPTQYPEWVTLEVAEGGFATGRALASIELANAAAADGTTAQVKTSSAFLADGGAELLSEMLRTGQYRLEHPENGALLTVMWLLERGRDEEARALGAVLAPYMDELRLYPYPALAAGEAGGAPELSTTVAAVDTVGDLRTALKRMGEAEAKKGGSYRHEQNRRQRAVAEGYAALQGDAIALLLQTTRSAAPPEGFGAADTSAAEACLAGKDPAVEADVEALAGAFFACCREGAAADGLLEAIAAVDARAAELAHRFGPVPSHTKATATTAIVLAALRTAPGHTAAPAPDGAPAARRAAAKRVMEVSASRGVKGSAAFASYLTRTMVSAVPDPRTEAKISAVLGRIEAFEDGAVLPSAEPIAAPVLPPPSCPCPCSSACACTPPAPAALLLPPKASALPPRVVRAIRRACAGTLEELIGAKVIVSADMIGRVLPGLLAAAAGSRIEDEAARRLYGLLSTSFAKRRSLLLLNCEGQVRFEELPWAAPLVALAKAAASSDPAPGPDGAAPPSAKACDEVVREAARCYLTHFSYALMPNKLVSALKDAMRRGVATRVPLVEEIAADIFQGSFSANFAASALVAARLLRGSAYARYYDLDTLYDAIVAEYAERQAKHAELVKKRNEEQTKLYGRADGGDWWGLQSNEMQKIIEEYYADSGKLLYDEDDSYSRYFPECELRKMYQQRLNDCYWGSYGNEWGVQGENNENTETKSEPNSDDCQTDPTHKYNKKRIAIANEFHELTGHYLSQCSDLWEEAAKAEANGESLEGLIKRPPPMSPRGEAVVERLKAVEEEYAQINADRRGPYEEAEAALRRNNLLMDMAMRKMAAWGMPWRNGAYSTVMNGQAIEAAMVLTTHNVAQLAYGCGFVPSLIPSSGAAPPQSAPAPFDFSAAAMKAWEGIVRVLCCPPRAGRAVLHARRDVAYAWRHVLTFVACVGGAVGPAVEAEDAIPGLKRAREEAKEAERRDADKKAEEKKKSDEEEAEERDEEADGEEDEYEDSDDDTPSNVILPLVPESPIAGNAEAQRALLGRMRALVTARCSPRPSAAATNNTMCNSRPQRQRKDATRPTHAEALALAARTLEEKFLAPLEAVINGETHHVAPSDADEAAVKAAVEGGAIVLGYYGWKSFQEPSKEKADSREENDS